LYEALPSHLAFFQRVRLPLLESFLWDYFPAFLTLCFFRGIIRCFCPFRFAVIGR